MKSLFKNIFWKNLRKGKESLHRFEADVGPLLGAFNWKQFDTKTGLFLGEKSFKNDITNLSKSTVIRLLSQGLSSYEGQINAENFKISKMRFGNAPKVNHDSTDDKILAYYDLDEKAYRNNLTNWSAGDQYASAGGGTTTIPSESGTNVSVDILTSSYGISWDAGNTIEINLTDGVVFPEIIGVRPPSHKTFKIEMVDSGDVVIQEIAFLTHYSRNASGSTGSEQITPTNPITDLTNTKIIYNYSQEKWKLSLALTNVGTNDISDVVKLRISFKVGSYNVINSIVPKSGKNNGSGGSSTRYTDLDYYSISTANVTYADSPVGYFIDDYSVTFAVSMNGTEGNGTQGSSYPVVYTEMFLFNENDDLFSIIREDPPAPFGAGNGFSKTESSAYFMNWIISVVL